MQIDVFMAQLEQHGFHVVEVIRTPYGRKISLLRLRDSLPCCIDHPADMPAEKRMKRLSDFLRIFV